jgi:hypothetical protein
MVSKTLGSLFTFCKNLSKWSWLILVALAWNVALTIYVMHLEKQLEMLWGDFATLLMFLRAIGIPI